MPLKPGLQIREQLGGKVTVLTMGPPQAETPSEKPSRWGLMKRCCFQTGPLQALIHGPLHIHLHRRLKKLGADIIFCGKQAIDGDTAQVGPETAEFLGIPHISYIRKVEEVKDNYIRVQRLMDEGYDIVESGLPVLLTIVKELNQPRMPSLKGKMAAKKAEIKKMGKAEIEADENNLGLKGSPTQVKNIFAPQIKAERKMIEGAPEEQVNALIAELRNIKCI